MVSHVLSLAVAAGAMISLAVPVPQRNEVLTHQASRSAPESTEARLRGTADDPPVLLVDDGTYEDVLGIGSNNPRRGAQAVFLNRFTPGPELLPFTLDTISILLPVSIGNVSTGLSAGLPFDVLVFADPSGSGDPDNTTSVLQQSFLVAPDNTTFQNVRLTTPVVIQSGDIWVGFTNTATASDNLLIFPGAQDRTGAMRSRSWVFFNTTPGDHFNGPLDTADVQGLLETNLLIRASGQTGGNTRVCWSAPAAARPEGGSGPPPVNTRICSALPPFPTKVDEAFETSDVLLGYNVYRSNQPGVQPTPENFFTSTPPTQTSASTSLSPSGSFFVVTAMYDTGESGPSNEIAIVPATITSVRVKGTKVVTRGMNFTDGVQVFVDGIPFVSGATLKKNGTRVVQKGPMITGQTIDVYLGAHGGQAKFLFRNVDGSFATMSVGK